MDPFEHSLRNTQRHVPSLAAWTPFSDHEHARFVLEKLTDFIRAQVPHFGDFRNGIMPLDVHRGLDLGWSGHSVLVTPIDLTGDFCTSGSEREFTLEERSYANIKIQAGADCDAAAADRSGNSERKDHSASLQGNPDHRSDLLPLAEGIRRAKT